MSTTTVTGPLPPPEPIATFQEWLGVDALMRQPGSGGSQEDAEEAAVCEMILEPAHQVADLLEQVGESEEDIYTPGYLVRLFIHLESQGDDQLCQAALDQYADSKERDDLEALERRLVGERRDIRADPLLAAVHSARYVLDQPSKPQCAAVLQTEMLIGVRFRYYEARVNDDKLFYQHVLHHVRTLFVACHMTAKDLIHPAVAEGVTLLSQTMYNIDELCRVDDERPPHKEMSREELMHVVSKLEEAFYRFKRYLAEGYFRLRDHPIMCMMLTEFARVVARFSNYQPPKRGPKDAHKLIRDFSRDKKHDYFDEIMEEMLEHVERSGSKDGKKNGSKPKRELVLKENTPTAMTALDPVMREALIMMDRLRDHAVAIGPGMADNVTRYLAHGYLKSLRLSTEGIEDETATQHQFDIRLRWNCNMTPEAPTSWRVTMPNRDDVEIPEITQSWENITDFVTPLIVVNYEVGLITCPPPLDLINSGGGSGAVEPEPEPEPEPVEKEETPLVILKI